MTHETGRHETVRQNRQRSFLLPASRWCFDALIPKVEETYRQMFAGAKTPPLLFFFDDIGQAADGGYIYDVLSLYGGRRSSNNILWVRHDVKPQ